MSTASLALTIPLAALLLLLAGLSGTVGLRGRGGALTRDGRMGVRTPASMASDEAFAVANRVAAPVALGAAAIALVVAVLIVALPLSSVGALILFVVALAAVFALLGVVRMKRLTRAENPVQAITVDAQIVKDAADEY